MRIISLTAVENSLFGQLLEVTALGSNTMVELVPTDNSIRTWILHEIPCSKGRYQASALGIIMKQNTNVFRPVDVTEFDVNYGCCCPLS
jgi:hypothetical protein